ncbi:MAG: pilus assembly protein [Henriciella sp.]|uniref:TadE/TadG family type IV pilus assembly protein n=1 Tax=Henriciella sp. TaxID=1968823 RepID=UPI00261717AB|nr:TadE/TadG family type IV pilus assembly protein [Henriciella sp.]
MDRLIIPGVSAPIWTKRFREWAADKRGVAAVEFAMIAIPFFFLIFGLLEICVLFIMSAVLENGLNEAARGIRTGELQSGEDFDRDAFEDIVCSRIFDMFECKGKIQLDVKSFDDFGTATDPMPLDADGNLDTTGFEFDPGGRDDIVVVRAFYEWDLITPIMSAPLANMSDNRHLLQATVVFRNEPF